MYAMNQNSPKALLLLLNKKNIIPLSCSCLLLVISFIVVFITGCRERATRSIYRSFYYWKSSFNLGETELKALNDLHITHLYVKFFDIGWNETKKEPTPMAVINFYRSPHQSSFFITPTVFITNECLQKMSDAQVSETAGKMLLLIQNIASSNNIKNIPEIQVDCDWTAGTKDKYFLLLQTIRNAVNKHHRLLSATIRLHQFKYYKKLGSPPVDRGLLMCYNMGNLKNINTKNSILEPAELKKYIEGNSGYPLPLDIALPVFGWKVLFRNKKFAGLISELSTDSLKKNILIKQSGNNYEVLQNTSISGYSFQSGDMLRNEEITFNDLLKAESIIYEKQKTQQFSLVLYHLDSITLSKFSTNELETIFDYLR
jgi:hypothetical protein